MKWEACAPKNKLDRFDSHIIYRLYNEDQNKVIQVKNLRIFKDITFKLVILLLEFERKSIFDEVQVLDE